MNEFRSKLLEIASNEIGNRDPTPYWRDVLGEWTAKHHVGMQWCGAFCLWALRQADLCNWSWSIAQDKPGFLFRLPRTKTPEPGDVAYFDKPYQHHALVRSVDGDKLTVVQGNPVVSEGTVSVAAKHPVFFSIQPLIDDLTAKVGG